MRVLFPDESVRPVMSMPRTPNQCGEKPSRGDWQHVSEIRLPQIVARQRFWRRGLVLLGPLPNGFVVFALRTGSSASTHTGSSTATPYLVPGVEVRERRGLFRVVPDLAQYSRVHVTHQDLAQHVNAMGFTYRLARATTRRRRLLLTDMELEDTLIVLEGVAAQVPVVWVIKVQRLPEEVLATCQRLEPSAGGSRSLPGSAGDACPRR